MTNFTLNNIQYKTNGKGYYYMIDGSLKTRIGKAVYEAKLEQYIAQQAEEIEIQDAKAEQKKPAKKSKKSKKNVAYEIEIDGEKITLTEKQKIFFENIPNDQYYDGHGEDCSLWTDAYCDTLADMMNAMVVGAIISTLREKNLIIVGQSKVNGKKCKFFELTNLGKAIFRDMGLA